tara:strand:- start:78 stop:335 length:258 start_codon:yes stop_codon:yes gene_type:complete
MVSGHKKTDSKAGLLCAKIRWMVPEAGLEPAHPRGRRILNPLRLPIPPLWLWYPCLAKHNFRRDSLQIFASYFWLVKVKRRFTFQ